MVQCKLTDRLTGEEGKGQFSFFLPSVTMNHLCVFGNHKLADGQYGLPDPTHKEGVINNGTQYAFDHFPTLENTTGFVLLKCIGVSQRKDGSNYGQFEVVSICNAKGFSAPDINNQATKPCEKNAKFIAELKDKLNAINTPVVS